MAKRLKDMEITAIALVGKPANKRRFLFFKSERGKVSKPYTGPGDKNLPDNVKELPKEKKDAWVKAFNNAWESYDKDKDKNYDADRTVEQNKERYCFAVANAVVNRMKEKTEKGGDEVSEDKEVTVEVEALDAESVKAWLTQTETVAKHLGTQDWDWWKVDTFPTAPNVTINIEGEEIEKRGAVLNKDNLKMLKQVRDLLTKVLLSAGVEKDEGDPPQEEPKKEVEAADEPALTLSEAKELDAQASALCGG